MHRYNHPLGITTKSDLVLRDLDLLAPMAARGLVGVAVSITTLDAKLARTMEPRCPRPEKRLNAVRELSHAGVPVAVMTAPMMVTSHALPGSAEPAVRGRGTEAASVRRRAARRASEPRGRTTTMMMRRSHLRGPVSYTHLTLPTKRIV